MHLEARAPNCFSRHFVLKLDERPVGTFKGRWFSEGIDIRLTERLQLHFEKLSWVGSDFRLIDVNTQEVLAQGQRAGWFTRTWNLQLRTGPAQLVAPSLFSFRYNVIQNGEIVASVERYNWCERGWRAEEFGTLDATDLVFVGLVYHTILERSRRNNNSS